MRGQRNLRGLTEVDWAEGGEVAEGADGIDMAAIYITIWFEHHGRRLYGVLELLNKKSGDWFGLDKWIPLRLLGLLEHLRC